ncbi:MAG: ABC transporter ATP-binding protein [Planctomycetes bacterium]|nr:ABC transporter ATP-binding protein [Planctomycetota bacterium]
MSAIETLDLDFRYGKSFAIRALRMRVEEGDIYGFLGPNGAGKTTTMRLLLGLVAPLRGTIRFFGEDLHRSRLAVLARVGTHLEGHAFYPYLSGRDNLILFARYHGAPERARIDELLETVGLARAARARVRTYSLGMKQRLGLAQALLHRPRLLVLDEPLNGLDPPGVIEVRELLVRLNREEGITVLLSSHRLDEAERICNRIGLIRDGALVREGRLDALLAPPDRQRYRIRTRDDARAQQRLAEAAFVAGVAATDGALAVEVAAEEAHRLARWLVEADLDVLELVPWRPRLEDLFRDGFAARGAGEGG